MCQITHWLVVFLNLESTDLEKVTVKSLDEIKREKEQRLRIQRDLELASATTTAHARSHDSMQASGSADDTGKDTNLFGKISIAYRHCISNFELK